MNQLQKLLASLSWKQRLSIVAAVVAVAGSIAAFTHWRRERDFRPLYTGLSAEDAGALVARLREGGIDYRLSENGSAVLVPSALVAETRLQMAAAGLPRSGRVGFELFDKTNFGITEFAEHINYRRALEGELERSVMALAEVQQARVHVTFPKESVFLEARQPAKASVLLRLRPGARISPSSVAAVAHLVASAVEGLSPEAVSVLDMNGRLLNRPRRPGASEAEQDSQAMLDFRQQVEKDLVAKITATLEPLLGADKFRAGVTVECDFTGGEQSEETFDPSRTVMASSQKTEDVSGVAAAAGVPGTASNLPRPASRPASSGGGMTRRTENITFQSSRLVRRTRLPQGVLKRISAAILVDQQLRWEGAGASARRVLQPPSPEKLKSIRELVAAAIGLVAERGDQLIIETLPFEATLALEPPAPASPPVRPPATSLPPWLDGFLRQSSPWGLAAAGAGALLVLVLLAGLWLWRRRRKRAVVIQAGLPGGGAPPALESGESVQQASAELEGKLAEKQAERERQELEALHSMKLPKVTTKKTEVLTKHLVEVAKKDPTGTAHVLRTWLRER